MFSGRLVPTGSSGTMPPLSPHSLLKESSVRQLSNFPSLLDAKWLLMVLICLCRTANEFAHLFKRDSLLGFLFRQLFIHICCPFFSSIGVLLWFGTTDS